MKKLLALMALLLVASMLFVACKTEPPVGPGENTTPDEVTTPAPDSETDPGSESETDTTENDTTVDPGTDTSDTDTSTEDTTEEPTAPPADPVKVGMSFDECDPWIGETQGTAFFTPGQASAWDKIANVEDYQVEYIRVWGWVAFFAETPGTFGYQIGDADPVFDAAFSIEAEQPVVDAAVAQGGKSAARMKVMIPVRDVSGEVVIKVLAQDAVGTIETLVEFTLNKAVDPANPVLLLDAAAIQATASGTAAGNHANQVGSAVLAEDGSYVTLTSAETGGDPWILFRNVNVNAQFIAVKYRTTVAGKQFHYFVASTGTDATGNGDMSGVLNYVTDGEWNVAILDISDVAAVNDENFLSFLRYDFYTNGTNEAIDVAWIGAFNTAEYAQAYFDKSMLVADTTNTFVTDANSNEVGVNLNASDLGNLMVLCPGTNGWSVVAEGEGKAYLMNGIDAITADMDGAYYFKANILQASNNAGVGMVARGYKSTLSSDESVQFKITNFYETDGTSFCGGSGIYAYVTNGTLNIVVKQYDPNINTRVANKSYRVACEGTELTIADNGYTVSIMVNGVTYATIDLSGSIVYEDITTNPEGAFATKAVVSLKDGTVETIENTLVAATVNSQVGFTCRASQFKFNGVEVGGYSAIEVPALEIVEPEPVDPNAPILVGDANYLANAAATGNQVASAVVSDDGAYVTITSSTGKDPSIWAVPGGSNIAGVKYIGLKYRTTYQGEGNGGEFFVGSATITGGADEIKFEYIADGEWHVILLSLEGHAPVVDGLVNYIRYDFFMGAENASIDIANIVLFGSLESANTFYGLADPAPEEPEAPANPNGTLEAPLSVSQTLAAVAGLESGSATADKYFTVGVVTEIGQGGSYYKNVYITDGESTMLIYTLNPMEGMGELQVGDTIVVNGFIKNYNGTIEYASNGGEYVYIVAYEAAPVENYNVPVDSWVITGHRQGVQDNTDPMVAAGGVEKGALLHQGYIGVGDVDLSKYSKAVIYFGIDGSQVTLDLHAAAANNRIMLTSADQAMTNSPTEEVILAGATYSELGWAVHAIEIDLTGVDYNGPVFVTYDTLPGTFMLIGAIEFVA